MREGWTYKKWSDVLSIINGKNQTTVECKDGKYPIYGSGGIMGHANDWLCPENCVIIGRKGNINKPIFVTTKFWNVDTAFGLNANESSLLPKFLFYFCQDYNFERHNKAVTIPSLTKADLLKIDMPIPSLSEQQSIVAELDKINELISLKKAQLSDLDSLAQSIFYDMFGDLHNTAFSVQTLNDTCEFIKDGTHQTPQYTEDKINGVKFLSAKDVVSGYIDWGNIKFIPYELHSELHKRIAPKRGDILLCKNGTTGICAVVDTDDIFDIYVSLALLRPKTNNMPEYLHYAINNPYTKQQFDDSLKGIGVPNLHLGEIKKTKIIIPPLPLQQEFAKRIELIEQQKAQISSTIKDLETLLASRMQYWFD